MSFIENTPVSAAGEAMAEEFRVIHDIIRRDLVVVRGLAADVAAGAAADTVRTRVADMAVSSPIWTLRVSCLRYCRFVHGHHVHEDSAFFPPLIAANPALEPAVERLKREHRVVAGLLDAIERQTEVLDRELTARQGLAAALDELAEHLLAHLDWEEDAIFPTLRRMTDWRT